MSDEVEVLIDANASDNATLLLAAAEELGLEASVVRTSDGNFVVPQEVHDKAFGKSGAPAADDEKASKVVAKKAAAVKKSN